MGRTGTCVRWLDRRSRWCPKVFIRLKGPLISTVRFVQIRLLKASFWEFYCLGPVFHGLPVFHTVVSVDFSKRLMDLVRDCSWLEPFNVSSYFIELARLKLHTVELKVLSTWRSSAMVACAGLVWRDQRHSTLPKIVQDPPTTGIRKFPRLKLWTGSTWQQD